MFHTFSPLYSIGRFSKFQSSSYRFTVNEFFFSKSLNFCHTVQILKNRSFGMNKLLGFAIAISLCFISILSSYQPEKISLSYWKNNIAPFALITIPKSGTHLWIKTLYHMTNAFPHWQAGMDRNFHDYFKALGNHENKHYFLCTHFCISPCFEHYCQLLKLKKIVCIRDLRDVCVSMVHHIKDAGWTGLHKQYQSEALEVYRRMSFDEQLLFVMNYISNEGNESGWQISLPLVVKQSVEYCKRPDVLICKYEDIVGEEGGGTKEAQFSTMKQINEFLNLHLSDAQLLEISPLLYGEKQGQFFGGFRRGKINKWNESFKKEHKEMFKKTLGWALIALGYEKDNNW
jgi:hypothetical protein